MKHAFVFLSALALAAVSFAQAPGDVYVRPYTDKKGQYHEGYWRRNSRSIPISEKSYVSGHYTKSGRYVAGGYRAKPRSHR